MKKTECVKTEDVFVCKLPRSLARSIEAVLMYALVEEKLFLEEYKDRTSEHPFNRELRSVEAWIETCPFTWK
jgi:hypothetical protein